MKLGAIDIGSNAARLLIVEVIPNKNNIPQFNKLSLVRVPFRLGFDVFEFGIISPEKVEMMMQTMKAFSHLLKAYEVNHLIACATSAMREAGNSNEIVKKIKEATDIDIEIISGDIEASLIYENHIAENLDINNSYLYIDVGGGSTELTFFSDGQLVFKKSFDIGTIRLLKGMVTDAKWEEAKEFIKQKTKGYKKIIAIGTGGNINKVFSLSKKKDGKPLHISLLKDYHKELASFSIEDRINIYNLRNDRADVIVPALQIYINMMRWAEAEDIFVPKIGLADGLIHHLYDQLVAQKFDSRL